MTDERIYCLDTSALINPWNDYYAPDLAPGYWRSIPAMVVAGRVVLSEEVREELDKIEDDLRKLWVSTKGAERSPRKVQRRSASAEHSAPSRADGTWARIR